MNIPGIFIQRPVATTLLTLGLAVAGIGAFFLLPVSPMPDVDFPTISVSASMPGASPETMATSVATPLERHLGAIADVTEMTSSSSVGRSSITLQFGIDRDIDGAARDVQAAIVAARVDLPTSLRSNPTYHKVNPASAPAMILALTSKSLTRGQIYDAAATILQQKLSQVKGVGEANLSGSSLPAVRVELNPRALFKYGIGLEDVRAALSAANSGAVSPKGAVEQDTQRYQIYVNDVARAASEYKGLVVAYRDNAPVRLSDIADVSDNVENVRNLGMANGEPAVIVMINKQPGANIIDVVNRVRALLPSLQAAVPPSIGITIVNDTTTSIRASVRDVERTLVLSTILVVLVVFLFLRNGRAALVPSVAVPLSLFGTFGVMYLLGYSLDNFSLMALTISTGFVVDDAIVVLENVSRHIDAGMPRIQAAMQGAREVSFTVLAMSLSLVAVFIPILLMGGLIGRMFHEFVMTLSSAILVSLVVSVTTTPMMCAYVTNIGHGDQQNAVLRVAERVYDSMLWFYDVTLQWAPRHPLIIMYSLVIAVVLNGYFFIIIPKGLMPSEDLGVVLANIRADQSISFQLMSQKFKQFIAIIGADPAVQNVNGYTGSGGSSSGSGGATNTGSIFIQLKPLGQRNISTDEVIARLRPKLTGVAGARIYLQGAQMIHMGGRAGYATYQYTLLADSLDDLNTWVPKITDALQNVDELEDVNSDKQDKGLEVDLNIDRAGAARYGINLSQIDSTLYDAFGQRQVSTIYNDLNQYHVVMEVAPEFWQSPETLKDIYISTSGGAISGTQATGAVVGTTVIAPTATQSTGGQTLSMLTPTQIANDAVRNQQLNALTNSARGGASTGAAVSTAVETMVPLSAVASYGPGTTPLSVNHQGPFVATTISFNLPLGELLSTAEAAIQRTMVNLHVPISIHGAFAGNALEFQSSLTNEMVLILAAIAVVYIVLGMLYESYIHPITILSTLPSAGLGAFMALSIFHTEFSLIAMIGIILLVGIVKKNAIMMIDFAVEVQRAENLEPREAIYRACLMRFRPIMMTTMAALLGALPLAVITGNGAELRQPLGISIVGGLIVSQALTLYTTPVVYLYLDRFRLWAKHIWDRWYNNLMGDPVGFPAE